MVSPGCTLSSEKRARSGWKRKTHLPVTSAWAWPRRNTPGGEVPGAEMLSTFSTSTRGECSSRNRIVRCAIGYMKALPKLPGKRTPRPGQSPVPTRFRLAPPSICPPPRKNKSMRPWPVRSKSSRVPSVKGLPLRLCSSESRTGWSCSFTSQQAAAGIGDAAPTAMCRAGFAVGSRISRARTAARRSSSLMSLIPPRASPARTPRAAAIRGSRPRSSPSAHSPRRSRHRSRIRRAAGSDARRARRSPRPRYRSR